MIKKILTHLGNKDTPKEMGLLPEGRAPPGRRFD